MGYITIYHPHPNTIKLSLGDALERVCTQTGCEKEDLKSKSRKKELVFARYLFFAFARAKTKASFPKIGATVNRSHADVIHGIACVESESELQIMFRKL